MELLTKSAREIELFWQLYLNHCENTETIPTFSDFSLWFKEQYG